MSFDFLAGHALIRQMSLLDLIVNDMSSPDGLGLQMLAAYTVISQMGGLNLAFANVGRTDGFR
ncbi:hypothetical protein GCM10011571_30770 [Marinithermofilum abyssi]|uniref:Uncharacterized protein n=1 Tax=Marinithermofilum abyssi TaxID=1571185 RepID=A0A8J2VJE0_9BACL|nr:hypothetical protein GCM10011571_30770 [Marinithermofilum abyssi]